MLAILRREDWMRKKDWILLAAECWSSVAVAGSMKVVGFDRGPG
jgi:hypothetical protein